MQRADVPGSPAHPGAPARPVPAALRRAAVPLAVLGGVGAAFGYVAAVDPNSPGHYPVCPLLHYTGLYCPGCGGLRGAYALAHGHLGTALECNAPAVAGYAVFAVVWTAWLVAALRGRPFEPALTRAHRWAFWTLLIGFGVVRNLPFGAALAP
ncbi:DUF2752 domain-containing protein [Streptomyces sp. PLK6-54]|uniref:DUF2752 domain-containing protein n=1 Tax=Actinacidiphila acidipaludis TaxID=2873382 RepID=A0ABS7Q0G6_9ACTN|nr:DUF2752 domain-containing protein [Streptomyces acidipaludis]